MRKIRYGTRGSALALAQSSQFARRLRELLPGLEAEPVIIHTSGDRFAAAFPAAPPEAANVKAMFVKEIEDALLEGSIDFAVHSCKDLPAELPAGLRVAAYPAREDARDVYIRGPASPTWDRLGSGAKVGTSALRRRIQLALSRPGVECVSMRGNVDTRLRRVEEGLCDGIILAKAGLRRLGREAALQETLEIEEMVPAPGQGALAIEAREDRSDLLEILARVDDAPTRLAVEAERDFMRRVGGGCRSPLGAHVARREDKFRLHAFWSDEAGERPLRWSEECPARAESLQALVVAMVRKILNP
ncbi:MAG: hydroxymethylbilane synthase [Elusimicrobia bacterium]|nr:hydroxymethylbilane synthase [Elusimicrobiota bacterium]